MGLDNSFKSRQIFVSIIFYPNFKIKRHEPNPNKKELFFFHENKNIWPVSFIYFQIMLFSKFNVKKLNSILVNMVFNLFSVFSIKSYKIL